jgi:hypothetical protein
MPQGTAYHASRWFWPFTSSERGLAASPNKGGKKNSKNALQSIAEYEHGVSAENNSDVEQGASAECISRETSAVPSNVEMAAPKMHPGSPAACNVVPEDRFSYLKNLSTNKHYRDLLNMIEKDEVCLVFHHDQQYFN